MQKENITSTILPPPSGDWDPFAFSNTEVSTGKQKTEAVKKRLSIDHERNEFKEESLRKKLADRKRSSAPLWGDDPSELFVNDSDDAYKFSIEELESLAQKEAADNYPKAVTEKNSKEKTINSEDGDKESLSINIIEDKSIKEGAKDMSDKVEDIYLEIGSDGPEKQASEDKTETETKKSIENIWIKDSVDFIPTRQTVSFDLESGKMFIHHSDMEDEEVDPKKVEKIITDISELLEDSMESAEERKENSVMEANKAKKMRRYLLLKRENSEKFINTKYLTNIRMEDVINLRDIHKKIMNDFSAYLEDDVSRDFLKANLCEETKTLKNSDLEEVLIVVVIKERVGEEPAFKTLPLQFEVDAE